MELSLKKPGTSLMIVTALLSACVPQIPDHTATPTVTPQPFERQIVEVPAGVSATIDGILSEGEWDDAMVIEVDVSRRLYLMHSDGYLFLGIESAAMGTGSICVMQDDEIAILHASAALGTAVYAREGQAWRRVRHFSWCCRESSPGPRQVQHLQEEGWLASIGYMGVAAEMEYQIALPGSGLSMAVVHLTGSSQASTLHWPPELDDDCLWMVGSGGPQERMLFSPETWPLIIVAAE